MKSESSILVATMLLLYLGVPVSYAAPLAFTADGSNLLSLDIATGISTTIGALGITGEDTEALAIDPTSGVLYLATDGRSLYTVDKASGSATLVGALGVTYTNGGMAIDGSGNIFLITNVGLFSVNKTTGAAMQIGSPNDASSYNNNDISAGLSSGAFVGNTLYAGPDNATQHNLYTVNTATGHATTIGALGVNSSGAQTGMTYDANTDILYILIESTSRIYSVDYATGQATEISSYGGNFEGLALADPGNPAPLTAPDAPTGATASAGNAQATVTWTAPTDTGSSVITGYTVTAVEDNTKSCTTANGSTLTCTVTGLTNGTAYTFTVTATNTAGISSPSSPSNSVTPAAPAPVPSLPTSILLLLLAGMIQIAFWKAVA